MNTHFRVFQSHESGDLLLRFQLELSTADRELAAKFGDQDIEVGGTFFTKAVIHPVVNGGTGAITSVVVDSAGAVGTYSATVPVTVVVTDPGGLGVNAVFAVVVNPSTGVITSVTPTAQGTGYASNTTLALTGDHVTTYAAQKVQLVAGFPYVRRVSTIAAGDSSLAVLATNYISALTARVTTALATLRALGATADLTNETVTQP